MRTIDGDDDSYDKIDKKFSKIWHNADDKLHRDGDLPAVIYVDRIIYCKNGKLHRDGDLPAVIWANGDVSYYVDGQLIMQFDI